MRNNERMKRFATNRKNIDYSKWYVKKQTGIEKKKKKIQKAMQGEDRQDSTVEEKRGRRKKRQETHLIISSMKICCPSMAIIKVQPS
jgi:hypothetical protein